MDDLEFFSKLVDALNHKDYYKFYNIGKLLFRSKTQSGIPLKIAYTELNKKYRFSLDENIIVTKSYLDNLTKHNIKSGMPFEGERHKKMQEMSKKKLIDIINGGEVDLGYE